VAQPIDCETIGVLYETAGYGKIRLALFSLEWQSADADSLEGEGPCAGCATDLNGSGATDVDDLLQVLGAFGTSCTGCPEDVDDSGDVSVNDLLLLIAGWGPC
jgi:hypothetical protein